MVLPAVEAFAGGEVKLAPAVGAVQQPGEIALSVGLRGTTPVLPEFLYPPPFVLGYNGLLRVAENSERGCAS